MRWLIVAGLMLIGPVYAQEAFQGIPWGATEQQIRAKFGGAIVPFKCTDTWRSVEEMTDVKLCGAPTIYDYKVAEYSFRLSFQLGKQSKRLQSVVLVYEGVVDGGYAKMSTQGRKDFDAVRSLLVQEYGEPEWSRHDANGTAMSTSLWKRTASTVHLQMSTVGDDSFLLEIYYTPATSVEAEKL